MEKQTKKLSTKKILLFAGIGIDVAATVFLLVVAIIMLATLPSATGGTLATQKNGPFIGYLQDNPLVYGLTCVLPLILLLILNIVGLVIYVRRAGKRKLALSDLSEEQKAALKEALLKDVESDDSK